MGLKIYKKHMKIQNTRYWLSLLINAQVNCAIIYPQVLKRIQTEKFESFFSDLQNRLIFYLTDSTLKLSRAAVEYIPGKPI